MKMFLQHEMYKLLRATISYFNSSVRANTRKNNRKHVKDHHPANLSLPSQYSASHQHHQGLPQFFLMFCSKVASKVQQF
jgi:hypothetical protein